MLIEPALTADPSAVGATCFAGVTHMPPRWGYGRWTHGSYRHFAPSGLCNSGEQIPCLCAYGVIRYGVDFPFETEMFVAQQKQALAQYEPWVQANTSPFREGQWYFAGRPLAI